MKVELNIENDKELRSYIKDCIRGQVLSIVREEFLEIVRNELERKMKEKGQNFDYLLKIALREAVIHKLADNGISYWSTEFIKPYVDSKLDEVMKDVNWERLINEGAKRMINKLLEDKTQL